jgi:hypothetical protein
MEACIGAAMFLRFTVAEKDSASGRELGVFMAAGELRDKGLLSDTEYEHLLDVLVWFAVNLKKPSRFTKSGFPRDKAICWFKSHAQAHIEKIWDLVWILEHHDRRVKVLKTHRPGYIAYEDQEQVAAIPFRDTDL